MGIKGLTSLIQDEAPGAIQERDIKSFFGRKVALDASQALYSFLIAIRSEGQQLMNESGETTSHLMGFLYRTLRMVENGMKVCYVFDGRPPDLKSNVLKARFGKREEAREEEDEEKDVADSERIEQLARRQVRPTRTHNDEVKQLLKLMGIPCVTAPSEAEAQCAELCRAGKVYAAGSEDMDTVTFATPILLRHLTFSEAKKMPVHEVNLEKVLEGMDLTMDQFIDLCILLGCDYLEPVKGIGPKTAFKLIKDHGNIEAIREHLEEREKEKAAEAEKKGKDRPRGVVFPEVWPFEEARKIFKNPDVIKADDMELKWEHPDVEGMVKFLCTDKGFSEDRVRKGAEKLTKALGQKQQGRLDGFFKVQQAPKRKAEDEPSSSKGAKGGKGGKGSDSKASGSKKKK